MNIVKYIFISFIAFTISISLNAQTYTGISVGSNFSYLTGNLNTINQPENIIPQNILKPGVHLGMFWNIRSGYNGYIEVGGFISQQGALYKHQSFITDSYTDTNSSVIHTEVAKYTYKINQNIYYFKVPFVWKQMWKDWYTKIGFWGDYALSLRKSTFEYEWTSTKEFSRIIITESDIQKSFELNKRFFDVGLTFGLGVQLPINRKNDFFFDVNYNHGLIAMNTDAIGEDDKMMNRYFTVTTGIVFGKDKYKIPTRR